MTISNDSRLCSRIRDGSTAASRAWRLLVIEDDPELNTLVVRIAQRVIPESDVDWARSAGEARRFLSAHDYDLVLADYFLEEDERGTSLLVESHRKHPTTALAMMSALPLEKLARVAEQELPVTAKILPKPFGAIDLCALLYEIRAGGGRAKVSA